MNKTQKKLIKQIKARLEGYEDFCIPETTFEVYQLKTSNKASMVYKAIASLGFNEDEMVKLLKVMEPEPGKLVVLTFVRDFVFEPPEEFWVKKYGANYSEVKREVFEWGKTTFNMRCPVKGTPFQLRLPWILQTYSVKKMEKVYQVKDYIEGKDFLEGIFVKQLAQSYGLWTSHDEDYASGLQAWLKKTSSEGLEERDLKTLLKQS